MRRNSYGTKKRRKRKNKYSGPDFGKLYKEKKSNRLGGFFLVLLISLVLGVGAYAAADFYLDKKEAGEGKSTPVPVATATPEATATLEITPEVTKATAVTYPDGFMADFTDNRVKTDAKGIYVNTSYLGRGNYPTID